MSKPDAPSGSDLVRAQRTPLPKRFYQAVTVEPAPSASPIGDCHRVLLDGRPMRTPAKRELAVPGRGLAQAVAAEWQAQVDVINPASMPLTRLVNTALDGVMAREAEVRADIVHYAGSDLVCYLAAGPADLVARQDTGWGPARHWLEAELGVALRVSRSVTHVAQDPSLLPRMDAAFQAFDDAFALAALHVITTLTGSAILALACARGRLDIDQAWALAHIDEDYQIETWGQDAEAQRRRLARGIEIRAAGQVLAFRRPA